jgi:hypothetical protein
MPVVSNSKLTKAEKMILRDMRAEQGELSLYRNTSTTLVCKYGVNTVRFATSVRSPAERKQRNKVGEYHARTRMDHGEVSVLGVEDFDTLINCLDFYPV